MVQKLNGWCSDEDTTTSWRQYWTGNAQQDRQRSSNSGLSIRKKNKSIALVMKKVLSSPLFQLDSSRNDAVCLVKIRPDDSFERACTTTLGDWHTINYNDKASGRLALITKVVDILSEA